MKLEDFEALALKRNELILLKFHDREFNLSSCLTKYYCNKIAGFYKYLYNVPKGIKCVRFGYLRRGNQYKGFESIELKKIVEIVRLKEVHAQN